MRREAILVLLATLCASCARETVLIRTSGGALTQAEWSSPPLGPGTTAPAAHGHFDPSPPGQGRATGALGRSIVGGEHCLGWLRQHGIAHRPLDPRPGMATPVEVEGPIGGIWFRSEGVPKVVCDCRLAVALHWVAPELRAMGVTEVRHSGAYVYRTQKNGKPSLHARGLAIDVHDVAIGEHRLSVKTSYRRGIREPCQASDAPLNQITCRLERTGLFKELITPDDDRDHHDHLHLAIAPH